MPRTVDPQRHTARRLHIIDAALTRFAADGYAGATVAAICRTAGIGSGTFFHYFATKADVLIAILDYGTAETTAWFAAQSGRGDAPRVLLDYVDHAAFDLTDPRAAGFIRAVSAVLNDTQVAAALAADEQSVRDGLIPWVRLAQRRGEIRGDLAAEDIVDWLHLLIDGFAARIATRPGFTAEKQAGTLHETAQGFLMKSPSRPQREPGPMHP